MAQNELVRWRVDGKRRCGNTQWRNDGTKIIRDLKFVHVIFFFWRNTSKLRALIELIVDVFKFWILSKIFTSNLTRTELRCTERLLGNRPHLRRNLGNSCWLPTMAEFQPRQINNRTWVRRKISCNREDETTLTINPTIFVFFLHL